MRFPLVVFTTFLVIFGVDMAGQSAAAAAGPQEGENVRFKWAFETTTEKNGIEKPTAITRDTTLKTGDQFRLIVELQNLCFVYVIYRSPQDDIHLLFPYTLQQFHEDYTPAKTYAIPQDNGWFELDKEVGPERFYVLASSERLGDLEKLLSAYAAAEAAAKPALVSRIVTLIRDLRKQHQQFTTRAERPTTIAGNVRFATEAVDVSAPHFYGKTITIDHQ